MYPTYRGTYRAHPSHSDIFPEAHEVNQLFYWFLDEGGELGVVQDIQKALRFAELLNLHSTGPEHFEVVECADMHTLSDSGGAFLGYDISAGFNNSLLSWQLHPSPDNTELPPAIRELYELLCRHYVPQLNRQGLFQTSDIAAACLRSMIALQDLSPNLFEGGNLRNFHVLGLYRILSGSGEKPLP
jgi:hypothetical protein